MKLFRESSSRVTPGPKDQRRASFNAGNDAVFGSGPALDQLPPATFDPLAAGQRLFGYGYELEKRGESDVADLVYRQSVELLEDYHTRLHPDVSSERLARLALSHGINLLNFGKLNQAKASFARSVELAEALMSQGVTQTIVSLLGESLNWYGRALRMSGEHQLARESHLRAAAIWRQLIRFATRDAEREAYHRSLAFSLFGASKAFALSGERVKSRAYLTRAHRILNRVERERRPRPQAPRSKHRLS